MVHFICLYRYTDQSLIWYISNRTDVLTHGMIGHTDKLARTACTSLLSDQTGTYRPCAAVWHAFIISMFDEVSETISMSNCPRRFLLPSYKNSSAILFFLFFLRHCCYLFVDTVDEENVKRKYLYVVYIFSKKELVIAIRYDSVWKYLRKKSLQWLGKSKQAYKCTNNPFLWCIFFVVLVAKCWLPFNSFYSSY